MLKGRTPLLIAIGLGLLAGAVAYGSLRAKEREVRDGWNLVPVLVAAEDLEEGSVLSFEMIAKSRIPEQFVTGSVVRPEYAESVIGQRVIVPMRAGDPILWSQFETARSLDRLSPAIMKKGRAITVSVNEKSSVGGWIRPNDHVDVIGSIRDPNTQEIVTLTLLQNVLVLATGKSMGTGGGLPADGPRGYGDLSLLVLPEEAEILVLAQELGSLTFVLRNPEELDVEEDRGRATIGTLLTGERSKALRQLRYQTIQVIRGSAGTAERSGIVGAP
ncbi:Flp pilus assembly protein CpaB [Vulgatibacter incomptus]|uniref:Flp pilus assembly protein RcpC/CpaB n=1 Tax=Vulgatibacter incomptus TaxID=1391653 RepID=A0A0K1PBZ1_9BACT|nr:Flp pilus assembly protein CpaB [Vulgatibacter incomptus]AKU90634.1 Flp pilus assembly protein RcpC/CpaB [Vulgatibacter incomptus]